MLRYTFQVNMHFGKREVSASAISCLFWKTNISSAQGTYPVFFAPTLPAVLRKIKNKVGLKLEEIVLEFQPEC